MSKRFSEGFQMTRYFILIAGVTVLVWLLWWLPKRQVIAARERLTVTEAPLAENEFRKTLAQIIGGLLILIGLSATYDQVQISRQELAENSERSLKQLELASDQVEIARQELAESSARSLRQLELADDQVQLAKQELAESSARSLRQLELTEAGQVTERFARAVEQVGSEQLSVRVGGIYSLERIARDSARDRAAVVRVLNNFLQENVYSAARINQPPAPEHSFYQEGFRFPSAAQRSDVDAALQVLNYLVSHFDNPGLPPVNLQLLDLSYSKALTGAHLRGADLFGVQLCASDLRGVKLDGANLREGSLAGANLEDASLRGANLEFANLGGAVLRGAVLEGAEVAYADLSADLTGVDLSVLRGLQDRQLESACSDGDTVLPEGSKAELADCIYFYSSFSDHGLDCSVQWPVQGFRGSSNE